MSCQGKTEFLASFLVYLSMRHEYVVSITGML